MPFEIPRTFKYVKTNEVIDGQHQEVQNVVQEPDEPPSATNIASGFTAYGYSEVIWPLSEPVLLPIDEVAGYVVTSSIMLLPLTDVKIRQPCC